MMVFAFTMIVIVAIMLVIVLRIDLVTVRSDEALDAKQAHDSQRHPPAKVRA